VIPAKHLKRDVVRGTDIDLEFEVSESRDLKVQAYVNPSGPEFSQTFVPTLRDVPVELLREEVQSLGTELEKEKTEALSNENYEVVQKLERLGGPLQGLHREAMLLMPDDVTGDRYKLEYRKRKIAQELYLLTADKRQKRLRADYQTAKDDVTGIVNESGNDLERRQLHERIAREDTFLNSTKLKKLEEAIDDLRRLRFQILRRKPDFLIGVFQHLIERRDFNDQLQAKNLIEPGKRHIAAEDWDKLDGVICCLYRLLPQEDADSTEMRLYFDVGIT